MREDGSYPLVVRNVAPLVQRWFMLAWVGILLLVTRATWRQAPPGSGWMWPWVLLAFWAAGIFALRTSFQKEAARLTIEGWRRARLDYGPPLRRRSVELSRLILEIDETEDGDGDPYFHLVTSVDERKIIVSEGHNRERLERLRSRILDAMEGSRLFV